MLSASSTNNHSLFAFGLRKRVSGDPGDTPADTFEFLPSVSFDDLPSSLESSAEFNLTDFPTPAGQETVQGDGMMGERPGAPPGGTATRVAVKQPAESRASRSSSLLRGPTTTHRQPSPSSVTSSNSSIVNAPPSAAGASSRRQNHYPPVSNANVGKTSRKSVVPVTLKGDHEKRAGQRRRPSLASSPDRVETGSMRSSVDGGLRPIRVDAGLKTTGSWASNSRMAQLPVLPAPSRAGAASTSNENTALTPDPKRSSRVLLRSPGPSLRAANTPSSTKRMSIAPGVAHSSHVGGLGARTISPTDARRMKRLSMHQNPSVTKLPQPPLATADIRPSSRSPSMLPRKTSTPSSSRTSPDPNRKSYSSGLSVNSTTSYNTVRTSTGSIQPRIPQSVSLRLPAPKALSSNLGGGLVNDELEDVPPVPAIPKAYESPKDSLADAALFEKRKSNLAIDASSVNSTSTGSLTGEPAIKIQRRVSHRKSAHTSKVGLEKKTVGTPCKKTLQPLRLPPITLAPLSTPTTAKIAKLQDQKASTEMLSPVSVRRANKTPTTPLTASKASFFSRHKAGDKSKAGHQRSSSNAHRNIRESPPGADGKSSSESVRMAVPVKKGTTRSGISPFLSSSVPKGSDFETFMSNRSKTGGEYTLPLDSELETSVHQKPNGPRAPAAKSAKPVPEKTAQPSFPSPDKPPTPSSMTSLRRKLSLSWKRSGSKASSSQSLVEKEAHSSLRQEAMPPPRIPKSATIGQFNASETDSPTLSNKSNGSGAYLESRRRKSSTSSLTAMLSQPAKKDVQLLNSVAERSNASHRALKPQPPLNSVRGRDVWTLDLDKDDMVAEEEMKKLGMRRKETELAARTLDALRKRASAKERVSPQEAIRIAVLNIYERGEIVDFKDVYFCGTQNAAKVVGDVQSELPNAGYDDERGDYSIISGDHLAFRYEIIDVLGKGSFGQVVRCIDHKTGVLVAVKIIRNKRRFHQQALVEVNILQKLREWDPHNKHSMVNFTHSFYFRSHLCISTELLDMNLYEFIKSNQFRGFSLKLIRRFTKQLLGSLNLLKQHKVIHCDLKPENILLRHPLHSEIKVIDFGSSCFENERVYTYIQSRFYRSPEVILGMTYGMPIDMWSLGCILAELYTGVPIFPGENEQEQLACIMEVFGPPEKHLIEKSTRKKIFFDSMGKPRLTVSSKGRRRRPSSKPLQQVLKCDDESFLDFIARCLRWDPDRRMKPDDAIRHEFITGQRTAVPVPYRSTVRDQSPSKRSNSNTAPRPLPEPPAAAKAGSSLRPREKPAVGGSPMKPSGALPTRRVSTLTSAVPGGLNQGAGSKRTSTGLIPNSASGPLGASSLPRVAVAARSASGRQDIAAAGATAAMGRRA